MTLNLKHPATTWSLLVTATIFLLSWTPKVFSQDYDIRAEISATQARAGTTLTYTLTISENLSTDDAPEIEVKDLQVSFAAPGYSLTIVNGRQSSETKFHYLVRASKVGNYTIPSQEIRYRGKVYRSNPVSFEIVSAASAITRPSPSQSGNNASPQLSTPDSAFREIKGRLELDKDTVYVGEAVTLKLHMDFPTTVNPRKRTSPIDTDLQGFTKGEWELLTRQPVRVQVDGKTYNRVSYAARLTPVKPGELTIDEIRMDWLVETVSQGSFGDDIIQYLLTNPDPSNLPMGPSMENVTVESESLTLEVKALPEKGKPESFRGAVGKFGMLADWSPRSGEVGDPFELRIEITGVGDLSRVSAPELRNQDDYFQLYDSRSEVEPEGRLHTDGKKTFTQIFIANAPTQEVPPLEFSYFDPYKEEYVTLEEGPFPLVITGKMQSGRPDDKALAANTEASVQPEDPSGLQPLITDWESGKGASFQPVYRQPVFWAAQGVPVLALVLLVAARIYGANEDTISKTRRERQLRRRQHQVEAEIGRAIRDGASAQLFSVAAEHLQISCALADKDKNDPASMDDRIIRQAVHAQPELTDFVNLVLEQRDENLYAGAGPGKPVHAGDEQHLISNLQIYRDYLLKK